MKQNRIFNLKSIWYPFYFLPLFLAQYTLAQTHFEKDTFFTNAGNLSITFIGHGSLMFEFNNLVIHVDPTMKEADYSKLPKADIILVTHHHGDHMDIAAIGNIQKNDTKIVLTEKCIENAENLTNTFTIKNGEEKTLNNLKIEAIPAYNILHMRSPGNPYHPKGEGNGYIITLGDKKIYIAGDTENIPEIKTLENIDIAFLPMNLPYTMTPEMVADAAVAFKPKILYPYHYGKSNTNQLLELLKNEKSIEIRVRNMQ